MYIQDIWDEIYEADKNKYIVCASSGEGQLNKQRYDEMGLISEHAYAVIQTYKIQKDNEEIRLLKLRNPWGHKEWLGNWSDTSELWTDELRKQVGCEQKNDGVFFICVEDYLSYFRNTVICKLHKDYVSNAIRWCHMTGEHSKIKVIVKENGKMFFTVSQLNQRWVRRNEEYEPSFVRMILAKERTDDDADNDKFPLQFIEGKCWKDEDTTIECECKPGTYIAYVEIHWFDDKRFHDFVFRTYSKEEPELVKCSAADYPNFIKDVLKSCARDNDIKKSYEEKGEPDIYRSFSITASKAEYGFLYYENNSEGATLREMVKFGELNNLVIMERGGSSVQVEVGPGENEIIVLDRTDRGCSFNCTYYTTIVKPIEESLIMVKEHGREYQIEYNHEKFDIFYYIYKDGSGYLWQFENRSNSLIFESTFYFKLENLFIDDEAAAGKDEWKVKLKPGETSHMKLMMKDLTQSWGYKYSYSFKCKEDIKNNEQLLTKVKDKGTKKQISYRGKEEEVYYYIYFANERYIWYYENLTKKKFRATFRFDLTNLKIELESDQPRESEDQEIAEWVVFLNPGET